MKNREGKLNRIVAATGEAVVLEYTRKGLLAQVTDPQGRVLKLNYPSPKRANTGNAFTGVQSIDSPVGRFGYEYGSAPPPGTSIDPVYLAPNLVKVSLPASAGGSAGRLYHYENARHPTFLTGISVVGHGTSARLQPQCIGTYLYGADGKGILTVRGVPARLQTGPDGKPLFPARLVPDSGVEQVTFDRSIGGQTTITNSLGQKTVYRYAVIGGAYRLLEVRGPGCASCGRTNVRYGYDGYGRLTDTTDLSLQGAPLRTVKMERDAYGRVVELSVVQYRQGKPEPAQWQLRYTYTGAEMQPSAIGRPSVVVGKEARISVVRNDKGQLLKVTEDGWEPAQDGTHRAIPITRITTYGYRVINGRSLLGWIDGPLSNGKTNSPADSDITQFEYDSQGNYVRKIIAPGNLTTTIAQYDAAGHPAAVESSDGIHPAVRTLITYDNQGRPARVSQVLNAGTAEQQGATAWLNKLGSWFASRKSARTGGNALVTRIDYDAQGRPRRLSKPDGTYVELLYDTVGRVAGIQDPDGSAVKRVYDTENKLLLDTNEVTSLHAPLEAVTTYHWDAQGRVDRVREPAGAVTRYVYDPVTGNIAGMVDALQRRTDFAFEEWGNITDVLRGPADQGEGIRTRLVSLRRHRGADVITAGNGVATELIHDDFGRLLKIASPDSGTQIAKYDAADRLILRVDGNGNRTSYAYNASGAVVERTTKGTGSDGSPVEERVTYHYEGAQLRAVSNPHQRTEFAYDRDGRLVEQIDFVIAVEDRAGNSGAAGGKRLRFVRRFTYDRLGRLGTRSLPSGESLVFAYDKSGSPHGIELRSADGKTAQPIVTDIALQRFTGLVGFKHGNGVSTRYGWDKQSGQLKQLLVTPALASSTVASKDNQFWSFFPRANAATEPGSQAEPLYAQSFDYDVAGRITSIVRSGSHEGKPAKERYGYDPFDHLSEADTPLEMATWRYDASGNRLAQSLALTESRQPAQAESLQYEAGSNRLTRVTGAASGGQAYQYDAAGNPIRIGLRSYKYGVTGRLERVLHGEVELARYAYNAEGERVAKTEIDPHGKTMTTYFLYHGRQIEAEVDDEGNLVAQYIYLGHTPVAKLEYAPQRTSPDISRSW
jgi:YD repeat-containing protein